ncbi:Tmn3p Ecym_7143 [Eremothecium cymbalariae DBVPG|uniref:Transmembrane 9 superfamily member n=1 Tax=Eremothecium cymbalariae (strain CBS 270.75 / DBVPG 7215 / KCTC 17166 / NRRL Y-17582) TaxID=931890 RepID=G8JVX7_ERECY|nr:hypothetical protein Ecym_7143 [Eremothecium cymbalariae DBVPG\
MRSWLKRVLVISAVVLGIYGVQQACRDSWLERFLKESKVVRPRIYQDGEEVEMLLNQVVGKPGELSYGYYDLQFTCTPTKSRRMVHHSLYEVFSGDRKWQSDYKLYFNRENKCSTLCFRKTQPSGLIEADSLIRQNYTVQLLIDEIMPASKTYVSMRDNKRYYVPGFPLGFVDPETDVTYLHNHFMLVIRYNAVDINKYTIVGFEVYPKSVSDDHCPGSSKDYENYAVNPSEKDVVFIPITYSVYWREEFMVDWENRWNFYLSAGDLDVNKSLCFRGIKVTMVFIILTLMSLAIIVSRLGLGTGSMFITAVASEWVRRGAPCLLFLNTFVSMGIQVIFAAPATLLLICSMGKLHNISNFLVCIAALCYMTGIFMSAFGGILLSGNLLDNKAQIRKYSVLYGSALPALTVAVLVLANSIAWIIERGKEMPFRDITLLLALYFMVSLPLSLLGGTSASYKLKDQHFQLYSLSTKYTGTPVSPSKPTFWFNFEYDTRGTPACAHEQIPMWLSKPFLITSIIGIIPFLAIYLQMEFIWKPLWTHSKSLFQIYVSLIIGMILQSILVMEICILIMYVHMHHGDDSECCFDDTCVTGRISNAVSSWRWKAFYMGGAAAWYWEAYSLYYMIFILRLRNFGSILLYLSYGTLLNVFYFYSFGSIGYLACCWFLNKLTYKIAKNH